MKKVQKNKKEKKILHGMAEIAGQGFYSVQGLRRNGHNASMVTWRKNIFSYGKEMCLNIGENRLLYPFYGMKIFGYGIYAMLKYDIFHFHFAYSLFPFRMDLWFLKKLKKTIFMEFHGSDIRWAFNRAKPDYFYMKSLPTFSAQSKKRLLKIFKYIDNYILHDYELLDHLPLKGKNIFFVPLRVDLQKFSPKFPDIGCKRPIIVHAPSNPTIKGSKYIISAIEELKENYDFEFILVEGKTQAEAIEIYKKADIIVDQLFLGTYGVFSIEAMALGRPVVCYVSEKMRKQYPDELPIVSATTDTIKEELEKLLREPLLRRELGIRGRKYVEDYHDYRYVTQELYEIYTGNRKVNAPREAFEQVKRRKEEQENV